MAKSLDDGRFQAVGRRKTSVARVFLERGKGGWLINDRPLAEYFPRRTHQAQVERPFQVTDTQGEYDVHVNVTGGGLTGQAGAIQLGIARALLEEDEDRRSVLREHDLLTRDARKVERKKYGRPKARKRFQFSKR